MSLQSRDLLDAWHWWRQHSVRGQLHAALAPEDLDRCAVVDRERGLAVAQVVLPSGFENLVARVVGVLASAIFLNERTSERART